MLHSRMTAVVGLGGGGGVGTFGVFFFLKNLFLVYVDFGRVFKKSDL